MPSIALAGPSTLVTDAGLTVSEAGGSLVDVVVAATLVATCVDPGVCAPGGGGFVTIDVADGPPVVIDGYMAFPGIGFDGEPRERTVTMEYGGGVTTVVGPGSVGVPGGFAALEMASIHHGSMPWRELVEIVALIVDQGFPMSVPAHIYFSEGARTIFEDDPACVTALFPGGDVPLPGETLHFEDLADSLRLIGEQGSRAFYEGELGKAVVSDMTRRGGRITSEDLRTYRAVTRAPLDLVVGGWEVVTNPAPAVGGAAIAIALDRIESSADPTDPVVWLEGLREAFSLAGRRLDGSEPDFEIGVTEMLRDAGIRSPSTIAVAGVDAHGSAVATSFSAGYGSGVIPEGTGILMNNAVGEIHLLPGGIARQIPGRRMLSNMAPTIARSNGDVVAMASPGAARITTALTISLARVLSGDSLEAGIEHLRVHPEGDAFELVAAESGLDLDDLDVRWYPDRHMFFGGVAGASLIGGHLDSHADSRRVGSAIVID